jgi:hypothetical protein
LLELNLFPNVKEITESMAAYEGIKKVWDKVPPSEDSVVAFFPGDGYKPRTGALFAMRTAWKCVSIDPKMRYGNGKKLSKFPGVDRLFTLRNVVENFKINLESNIVVIVLVHSHAKIEDCIKNIKGREVYVLSIPCCVQHDIGIDPMYEYLDRHILSPKNIVKVWRVR